MFHVRRNLNGAQAAWAENVRRPGMNYAWPLLNISSIPNHCLHSETGKKKRSLTPQRYRSRHFSFATTAPPRALPQGATFRSPRNAGAHVWTASRLAASLPPFKHHEPFLWFHKRAGCKTARVDSWRCLGAGFELRWDPCSAGRSSELGLHRKLPRWPPPQPLFCPASPLAVCLLPFCWFCLLSY